MNLSNCSLTAPDPIMMQGASLGKNRIHELELPWNLKGEGSLRQTKFVQASPLFHPSPLSGIQSSFSSL